jgi:hypothetical protein
MLLLRHAKTFVWNGSISMSLDFVVWLLRRPVAHWALRRVSTEHCVSRNSHKVILRCTAKANESQPYLRLSNRKLTAQPLGYDIP